VLLTPAVVAQDATPAPSPVASPAAQAEAQVTNLMQTEFEEFVPAPMTIRMLRITLEPGASTPMHTHPGPEFDIIESGDLTIRTEGDATVTRANGDTEAATEEEQVLAAGDWIVYQPGTGMFYENASEENVVLLSAVLLPVGAEFPESITYTDGQPTSRDFDGVSFTVLGDGLVQQMPSGPATVSIDSVVLPAGADLPAAEGVAMYSQVEGNFSFIVDSGAVQVSRSELQSLQPNAVTGEEFILEPGDAAFFPAGVTATSRADETGSLEMISLTVSFDEAMNRDAAELTFTTGSSATGDATGGAETPDTAETDDAESSVVGTIVTTNVADLNMRAEPSTEADVVDQLALGIELEVIGGPEEAEEYTWYQVQVTSGGGSSGWVAADFLDGLEAATPEETPAPEAASTPAAEAIGTFAPGDIVATIDDSVRVRSEGNLGGDIVNAYPTGTEFEITGEPVDADDFTWYPVTLVENPDITGWIPADFIAPAE
jgi:quercetin dioxygenase-like cupin family protein/uncharacterized protein YgiM (DUF1202 family)